MVLARRLRGKYGGELIVRQKAHSYLMKTRKSAMTALLHAEARPGVTPEELHNLREKVDIIDWLMALIDQHKEE